MHGSRFKTNPIKERFEEKFTRTETCWIWNRLHKGRRYGQFRVGNKMMAAHRVSWTLHVGEIPKNIIIRHKCDNPRCVNPEHLELGTQQDNMKDMTSRNRQSKGEHRPNSKLLDAQIIEIRQLYATGLYSCADLAILYSLPVYQRSCSTIRSIVSRKTWRHLP